MDEVGRKFKKLFLVLVSFLFMHNIKVFVFLSTPRKIKRKDEVLEKIEVMKFSSDATCIIENVNFQAELLTNFWSIGPLELVR